MRAAPWQVIDLMTGETLGWETDPDLAAYKYRDQPVTMIYRPGRKGKVKK